MQQPTVKDILPMQAGPDIDRLVHSIALGRPGRAPLYSAKDDVAILLVGQLPIGVARLPQTIAGYNPDKPFVAFTLERDQKLSNWYTHTSVTASTLALALCKMALIFTVGPKERGRQPTANIPKLGTFGDRLPLEPMPPRIVPQIPGTPPAPVAPPVAL